MKSSNTVYRPDIDGLRAIAVVAVVWFHAVPMQMRGGFVGVDVFFVISGYLISLNIFKDQARDAFSFREFYRRRLRRIFPALAITLLATTALGWMILSLPAFNLLGKHILQGTLFSSNFLLLRESGYFNASSDQKPLLHLWSLAIEEQFYLAWPILVALAWGRRRGVALTILLVGAGSFLTNILRIEAHPDSTFYLPTSRAWELMIGGALAWMVFRKGETSATIGRGLLRRPAVCEMRAWLALGAILGPSLLLNRQHSFPGWWALLPTLGTAVIINSPETWLNRRLLGHPGLRSIGLISYPLYLWHWPLLAFNRVAQANDPEIASIVLMVAFAVILAALTYRLVEAPVRRGVAPIGARGLSFAMIAIGLTGLIVSKTHRANSRALASLPGLRVYELLSPEISKIWRRDQCMLEKAKHYGDVCIEAAPAETPLVVLWGDSHAAALYPGLKEFQREVPVRTGQFSASRCPPILDYEGDDPAFAPHAECKTLNASVVERIQRERPRTVILTAFWEQYRLDRLADTLGVLDRSGVENIVILGSVPTWEAPLRDLLLKAYRTTSGQIVTRWQPDRKSRHREMDATLRALARPFRARFVSAADILCNDNGCLTALDHPDREITYIDADHVTPGAGLHILAEMKKMRPDLF